MSGELGDNISDEALADVLMSNNVRVAPEEIGAVVASLARINGAAALLLVSQSFDDTNERFYRMLEHDDASSKA